MSLIYASDALITPKTAAGSARFSLNQSQIPVRLSVSGLAGAEAVTLHVVDGPDEILTPVYRDGTAVTLTATDPVVLIDAPGPYQVGKPITAGASGVFLAKG